MKKHLAMICGVYYPEPSPTGLCAKRFAELLRDEYEIDLLCISVNGQSESAIQDHGVTIHTLAGTRMSMEYRAAGLPKQFLHLLGGVQIKTRLLGNLTWFRKAVLASLLELHGKRPFDAVFSICSPFAAHCGAMDFKAMFPGVHWCAYTVDPYSAENRVLPVGCSLDKLKGVERAVLLKADALLLSEEVYASRRDLYEGHSNCRELPYILPELGCVDGKRKFFSPEDVNCVYAGRFYEDIRNPEKMLSAFSKIENPKIKLHLFSRGCEGIVQRYVSTCGNIILHEQVPHDEINEVYRDADILVSISNSVSEFLPSKTFEYIATCKPIICFCHENQRDPVLEKYPAAYQVEGAGAALEEPAGITQFILNMHGKNLEKSTISSLFGCHVKERVAEILKQGVSAAGQAIREDNPNENSCGQS